MAKMTKSELVGYLRRVGAILTVDAETQSAVDFTVANFDENPRNVTVDELKETVKLIEDKTKKPFKELVLEAVKEESKAKNKDAKVEEPKVENKKKIIAKKPTKKEESEPVENSTKEESKPKITVKAKEEPKKESKKEETTHSMELLATFPQNLKSKQIGGNLKLRTDIKNLDDFLKAWNNGDGDDLVLATYWTKRHLRQYADSYDNMKILPELPKSFEHDLDLVEVTYGNSLVVTGISLYSSVPYIFLPRDFELEDDNMRYANGLEFQVYQVIE